MNLDKILSILFVMVIAINSHASTTNKCEIELSSDMPQEVSRKIDRALNFLASIEGITSSRMHKKIFGGFVKGDIYCNFIKTRAGKIYFDGRDGVKEVANFGLGILDITPKILNFSVPQIALILLHEAYHAKSPEHTACPSSVKRKSGDSLEGLLACDTEAYSSYGVNYVFSENVSKHCINCKQEDLNELKILGDLAIGRITKSKSKRYLLRNN
jgi:hypothetical protein